MTLSDNERKQLLSFIESHYVDHHDVILLIASDLEEDITTQMEQDEELSFEDALKQAYKKYGVIGFSDVSEDYMKKIDKYFRSNVLLKILKEEANTVGFWLLFILGFIIIYFTINSLSSSPIILLSIFGAFILSALIFHISKLHRNLKQLKKRKHKYYLDHLLASNSSMLFPISYLPLYLLIYIDNLTDNDYLSVAIIAFFTTLSFLAFYLIYFKLYKERSKILQDYKESYLSKELHYKLDVI